MTTSPKEERSSWLSDAVIALADGVIIPFALTAGLSVVFKDNHIIFLAGLTALLVCALSMGIGSYLAAVSELKHLSRQDGGAEEQLAALGLTAETRALIATEIDSAKEDWSGKVLRVEKLTGLRVSPVTSLIIFTACLLGGVIPLIPYAVIASPGEGMMTSVLLAGSCLLFFGYLKGRVQGRGAVAGALRTALTGLITAAASWGIAFLFV